jgi:hypothetical protein
MKRAALLAATAVIVIVSAMLLKTSSSDRPKNETTAETPAAPPAETPDATQPEVVETQAQRDHRERQMLERHSVLETIRVLERELRLNVAAPEEHPTNAAAADAARSTGVLLRFYRLQLASLDKLLEN